MRIPWNELDHEKYEDMISVLLSRLHPDAQRIDGKGGDGGRDVQILHEQGGGILRAFELKSFTGRMTRSRRKQVARSLCRAAALEPVSWTLVVPIDPTPAELEWFLKSGKGYCFPLRWRGKTWLDEKMSAFPDIRRYFLEGAKDEVYQLLWEIREEDARITEVHDAVGRLRNLRERLNEIDPHYSYELSTGQFVAENCPPGLVYSVDFGDVRVNVFPNYVGAIEDRPITVKFELAFEQGDEVVQDALNYGLEAIIPSRMIKSVEIDAPFGLGENLTGGELKITPTNTRMDEPVTLALDIMDEDRLITSCPVHLTERTEGPRGAILTGIDDTGWLRARLKIEVETNRGEANFRLDPKPTLPAALVPLFRWLCAFQPPKCLVMRSSDGSVIRSRIRKSLLIDVSFASVVEALAYLQEASGIYWTMPISLTLEEEAEIVRAASLMKEESIGFTWSSFNFSLGRLGPEVKELLNGKPQAFLADRDTSLELEGRTIPIGRVRTHIESARVANPEAAQQALASGQVAHLELIPGDSDQGQHVLISKPE